MSVSVFPAPASVASAPSFNRVAVITSSGTWTHPDGASASSPKQILAIAIGAGGGGGSGGPSRNGSITLARALGGGGGGAGFVSSAYVPLTGQATITIGASGNGGAAVTNSTTDSGGFGLLGLNGGATLVAFPSNSYPTLEAEGGLGGGPGAAGRVDTSSAFLQGRTVMQIAYGGKGSSEGGSSSWGTGANGFSHHMGTSVFPGTLAAGSGGGGGGVNSDNSFSGGTGGTHPTGNGGNGGASGRGANGTAGSNGTGYGAGGGGGGGCTFQSTNAVSGAGGNGSPGVVYIYY